MRVPNKQRAIQVNVLEETEQLNRIRKLRFSSIQELKEQIDTHFNSIYGIPHVFRVTEGPLYLSLTCSVCKKFHVWFKWEDLQDGEGKKIRFHKTVNKNHLKEAH